MFCGCMTARDGDVYVLDMISGSMKWGRGCWYAYLALFFVRISTCSWKSVIISLCFFFKSKVVSSDSR